MTIDELERTLLAQGWTYENGVLCRPMASVVAHVHSHICTAEVCGAGAVFYCEPTCIRVLRKTGQRQACEGHRVPTRARLIEYALRRRGLREAAARGTPLEEGQSE